MKRPLVWCAVAFILGTAVTLDFSVYYISVIAVCIGFTAFAYKNPAYIILLAVFFTGMLPTYIYNRKYLEPIRQYGETTTQLTFEVKETYERESSGGYNKYFVKASTADGKPFDFSGEIYTSYNYSEGDIVRAKCKIYPISDDNDMKYFKINSGCHFSAFSTYGKIIGKGKQGIIEKIKAFRRTVINELKEQSNPQSFGFLSAILTGDKEHLSSYRKETFRKTGLSHLMAVSGLHVSLLLGFILLILKSFRAKRMLSNIICSVFLLILIPFMNFSASAIRAVIMNLIMLWSSTVRKDTDSLTSLSFAAIILLIFRPYSLTDLSFVLSFTATLGLILLSPVIENFLTKLTKHRLPSLSAVLSVYIFMLPVNIYYFGGFSLLSLPANLIFVPVLPVIMIILIIALILGRYIPLITVILNVCTKIYLGAIDTMSKLPITDLEISITEPFVFLLIATIVLAFVFKSRMRFMFTTLSAMIAVNILIKSIVFF